MSTPQLPTFVVDIDLTIANPSHREHLLVLQCKECDVPKHLADMCTQCVGPEFHVPQECWDEFIAADQISLDTPFPEAQRVLNYLLAQGATVLFVTGRNESLREATIHWLQAHFELPRNYNFMDLRMRSMAQMHVPASVYKRGQVELIRAAHDGPLVFFEDDPYVQKMYAEYGLVFQGPDCWASMCPPGLDAAEEQAWRK